MHQENKVNTVKKIKAVDEFLKKDPTKFAYTEFEVDNLVLEKQAQDDLRKTQNKFLDEEITINIGET